MGNAGLEPLDGDEETGYVPATKEEQKEKLPQLDKIMKEGGVDLLIETASKL